MNGHVDRIAADLRKLGIEKGDLVLIRASARSLDLGCDGKAAAAALLNGVLAAVGTSGTVAVLTFTPDNWFWNRRKLAEHPFADSTPSVTGAFAQAMLDHPGRVRSRHPVNSFAAIGPLAGEVIRDHDESATSFQPIRVFVEKKGKLIAVGCTAVNPGFSTVHLAQEDLGLAGRTFVSGLTGAWFTSSEGLKWFTRRDVAGCSRGFGKAYAAYIEKGLLRTGVVAGAYSILIEADKSYEVDLELLRRDHAALLCDDPGCESCGTRYYAPGRMARFVIRAPGKLIKWALARR